MSRSLAPLLLVLASLACGGTSEGPVRGGVPATPAAASAPRAEVTLTLVGTNDLHGHIERLPLLAGYLENLAQAAGEDRVLLVDGGDMFQGTLASNLTEGAAVVRAYNALGYHAATVGNHEFDYGPVGEAATPPGDDDDPRGALRARAREARFPLLTANILEADSGERVDWGPNMPPTTELEMAGVKVGVIGVSTAETLQTTISGNVSDLAMAPLTEVISEHATRLRKAGVEVVVVSAHAGAECDELTDPDDLSSCDAGEILAVAAALPAGLVDVIVAGHTHRGVAHRVNGIAVIESFAYGVAFGRVDLTVGEGGVIDSRIHPPQHLCERAGDPSCAYEGAKVVADARLAAVIAPDIARAEGLRARPLGVELSAPFENLRGAETPLSRLFADLTREAGEGEIGVVNAGAIRATLPVGGLRYGDFYQAFPFDNRFARVKLSGAELKALIADSLSRERGLLTFSGLTGVARCDGASIALALKRDDGRPIGDKEMLTLATSDYLATSGIEIFAAARRDGRVTLVDGPPLREELIEALAGRPRLDPTAPSLSTPRIRHPGRPMRCPSP